MSDLLRASSPVLWLFLLLVLAALAKRYLFATRCWKCGLLLDARVRISYLLKFIPRVYCRRCGARTVKFL